MDTSKEHTAPIFYPEYESTEFLRNVCKHVPGYTASHPTREEIYGLRNGNFSLARETFGVDTEHFYSSLSST
jgi:hypothetical protein